MMLTRNFCPSYSLKMPSSLRAGPETGRRRGGDGDTTLAFLLHPVGDRGAFMHFADLVDRAGVEKNALRERRLARIDVGGNADVARALHRVRTLRRIGILLARIDSSSGGCLGGSHRGGHGIRRRGLETEVSKRAIGLRHLVHVVTFLDGIALAVGGLFDFGSERFLERHALALGRHYRPSSASRARAGAPAELPWEPGRWRHRRGGF